VPAPTAWPPNENRKDRAATEGALNTHLRRLPTQSPATESAAKTHSCPQLPRILGGELDGFLRRRAAHSLARSCLPGHALDLGREKNGFLFLFLAPFLWRRVEEHTQPWPWRIGDWRRWVESMLATQCYGVATSPVPKLGGSLATHSHKYGARSLIASSWTTGNFQIGEIDRIWNEP
jgi:hypothetical protein